LPPSLLPLFLYALLPVHHRNSPFGTTKTRLTRARRPYRSSKRRKRSRIYRALQTVLTYGTRAGRHRTIYFRNRKGLSLDRDIPKFPSCYYYFHEMYYRPSMASKSIGDLFPECLYYQVLIALSLLMYMSSRTSGTRALGEAFYQQIERPLSSKCCRTL
jgi:hypothetical protein